MKIGSLTFHGSYNFGSVLQAFALQKFVERICKNNRIQCKYNIINFRSNNQKELYNILPKCNSLKNICKIFMGLPYYFQYKIKNKKFEDFISNRLNVTKEFCIESEIYDIISDFDIIICGSDQIWNVRARDSNKIYFLNFTDKPRISYSASFGPLTIDWNKYNRKYYAEALNKFMFISTREEESANTVELLTGKKPPVHIDPTLLIEKDEWLRLCSDENIKEKKYILMYCLEPDNNDIKIAKEISRKMHLPIIITKYNNKYDYFNNFIKYYSTGPENFISLINNAMFVITSSFHGTAFSILLEKPFITLNGMRDYRISSLLKLTKLENRSVVTEEDLKIIYDEIDFTYAKQILNEQKVISEKYLINAFETI